MNNRKGDLRNWLRIPLVPKGKSRIRMTEALFTFFSRTPTPSTLSSTFGRLQRQFIRLLSFSGVPRVQEKKGVEFFFLLLIRDNNELFQRS